MTSAQSGGEFEAKVGSLFIQQSAKALLGALQKHHWIHNSIASEQLQQAKDSRDQRIQIRMDNLWPTYLKSTQQSYSMHGFGQFVLQDHVMKKCCQNVMEASVATFVRRKWGRRGKFEKELEKATKRQARKQQNVMKKLWSLYLKSAQATEYSFVGFVHFLYAKNIPDDKTAVMKQLLSMDSDWREKAEKQLKEANTERESRLQKACSYHTPPRL